MFHFLSCVNFDYRFQSTFSFGLSRFKFTPFYLTFPNNVPAIPVQIAPSMWIDELHSDSQSYEFQKLVTQSFGYQLPFIFLNIITNYSNLNSLNFLAWLRR